MERFALIIFPEGNYLAISTARKSLTTAIWTSQADDIEKILCHKFMRFMMMRAENFFILRRKPIEVRNIIMYRLENIPILIC